MSDGYTILTLDEVETAQHRGSNLIPVRHVLGFRPAGVNAWIADSGEQLIPPHEEDSGNVELYTVVRGRASFTVGEETADAPPGSLVFVPAEVFRTVGPSLAGFGDRGVLAGKFQMSVDNIVAWIMDPQAMDPGVAMPDMEVDKTDATDIAAYLLTLHR